MRTIVLIIALLSLTTAFAGNNDDKPKSFSISGKVVDNAESLTGVKVTLDGKEVVVYTDFEGNFIIEHVLAGEHTLSFSLITYKNKELTFNPINENSLEIKLNAQ